MIDIQLERVVSLSDAVRYVPRRNGHKIHLSTIFRWTTRGVRGQQLETIQVGNTRCTSVEALQRFFNRLTGAPAEPPVTTSRRRAKEIDRIERELVAAGM